MYPMVYVFRVLMSLTDECFETQFLFLEREAAEKLDPRDDRTSGVRSRLQNILLEKMRTFQSPAQPGLPINTNGAPSLPPIPNNPLL